MKHKIPQSKVLVGTVIRLKGNTLTVKIRDGKKRTYTVDDNATISCDGMDSTLLELEPDQNVRVTTTKKDFSVVTVIESLTDNGTFPSVTGAQY